MGVTDMDLVLRALAERRVWHGSDDGLGRPHACTPDGWPAHEPWRRAVIHAHESGAMGAVVTQAPDRLLRNDDSG